MKKLQNKILLIFFIIGTIIIIGMGAFFAGIVGETQDFIGTSEYVTSQDLINITDTQMNQAKILILGTILVFSCIVIVVGIFISEAIVKPLNKMIINAQKLANGESVELIELNPKKRRKKKRDFWKPFGKLMHGNGRQKKNGKSNSRNCWSSKKRRKRKPMHKRFGKSGLN